MKIVISGAYATIHPKINPRSKVARELYDVLAFQVPDYEYIQLPYQWDGMYRFYNRPKSRFKAGLIDMAQYVLKREYGEEVEVVNLRNLGEKVNFRLLSQECQLRSYQSSTILESLLAEGGVIEMPTQSGKTLTMLETARRIGRRTLIIVHTKDLLDQMRRSIKKWYGYSDTEIGQIGAGQVHFGDFTVATIQSLRKLIENVETDHKIVDYGVGSYKDKTNISAFKDQIIEYIDTVGTLLVDEGHHIPARTFVEIFDFILGNIKYIFVYSASPWRDDQQDMHIHAVGGSKIVEISNSYLIDRGYLRQPHVFIVENPEVPDYPNAGSYWQKYDAIATYNGYVNQRLAEILLFELDTDNQILVLVAKKEHGYVLREFIKSHLTPQVRFICSDSGKTTNHNNITYQVDKRSESLLLFTDRIIRILIGTSVADEGLAMRCDTVILAGRGKSGTRSKQRLGRPQEVYKDPETGKVRTKCYAYIFKDENRPFNRHFEQTMALIQAEYAWVIHKDSKYVFT